MKISVPTLLIDKKLVLKNISKMVEKAERNKVLLRPHFKTHQSAEIGKWFKELGVKAISVSSVRMAKCFAESGWDDITIAFPVNILEIEEINKLAKQVKLNLLVETKESIQFLQKNIETSIDLWIKIDTGYHRTGIKWDKQKQIFEIAKEISNSSQLNLMGILTHAGHSYKSRTNTQILEIHKETISRMLSLKSKLVENNLGDAKISVGDTPTASIAKDFSDVDEIRPGNFVFYDLKQLQISSCTEDEIAIRFACPVVAKNEERLELVIDGGAIHFSKDFIINEEGKQIFGYLTKMNEGKWGTMITDSYVSSLNQEHGIVKASEEYFNKITVGDTVLILPVHACLAANVMGKGKLTSGEEIKLNCR